MITLTLGIGVLYGVCCDLIDINIFRIFGATICGASAYIESLICKKRFYFTCIIVCAAVNKIPSCIMFF